MKAMSRKAVDRFADVDAFLDALIDAASVGPVGLPRRKPVEFKLVSGRAPVWPLVAPVLSSAQLEELGLSMQDLSQVPDADVVSISDPEPSGHQRAEDVTQATAMADLKGTLDESSNPTSTRDPERTLPPAAPSLQQTTPALKRVGSVMEPHATGPRELNARTVLTPRRASGRAAPTTSPVVVWPVLLATALGLGALAAWLATR